MEEKFASARRMLGKVTAIGVGLAVATTMTTGPVHGAVASTGTYTTTGLLDTVTDPLCGLLAVCGSPSDPNLIDDTGSDPLAPVTDVLDPESSDGSGSPTDVLDPVLDTGGSDGSGGPTDMLDPVLDPYAPTGPGDPSGEGVLDTVLGVSTVGDSAVFGFIADPVTDGSTYLCSLTGPSQAHVLKPCESPLQYTGLEPGDYVFSVMALDGGVEDLVPATHAWSVADSEAPQTRVAGKPRNNGWLLRRGTVVRVSANEDATFRCSLDGKMVEPCGGHDRLTRLGSRTHVFRAFAVDAAGNRDRTPAVKVFTVPRNNKALKHSAAWKKRNGRGYFLNSFSVTAEKGAVLQTRARGIKKLALVASTGRGQGTVEVLLGNRLLKQVSLHTERAQKRRIIPVAGFRGKKRGLVRVRVVSSGKPVRIQGLGIAGR
jgi:hypothetical protein